MLLFTRRAVLAPSMSAGISRQFTCMLLAVAFVCEASGDPCALETPVRLQERGISCMRHAAGAWALKSGYNGAATYEQPAGHNHYQLFAHLAKTMAAACGGAELHICDVGTNFGDSARAWVTGSPEAHVATFDLDDSPAKIAEVQRKMGGPASAHTAAGVREYYGPRVRFYRGNLVENKTLFRTCANSTLMLLDTAHYPETDPFELGFVQALHEAGYRGLVLMDDTRMGRQMKGFWAWVVAFAQKHGYLAHDLTRVGHFSGTGLLDFSGGKLLRNMVAPGPPARCNCEPATVEGCRGKAPPAAQRKKCAVAKTGEPLKCVAGGG